MFFSQINTHKQTTDLFLSPSQHKPTALSLRTHQECFAGVKQMLERETWYNVPISVEDLGGMAGVIGNHTRGLAWPAMNGWGYVIRLCYGIGLVVYVKERFLDGLTEEKCHTH